jgi:RHS repeat-associated protein
MRWRWWLLICAWIIHGPWAAAQPAVWYSDGSTLYQADAASRVVLRSLPVATNRIAADGGGGVWYLTGQPGLLRRLDASGVQQVELSPAALGLQSFLTAAIAASPRDGSLWLAARTDLLSCSAPADCPLALRQLSQGGQVQASAGTTITAGAGHSLAVDLHGQPWMASQQALVRFSPQGVELQRFALPATPAGAMLGDLVLDPMAPVAWVVERRLVADQVRRIDLGSGSVLDVGTGTSAVAVQPITGESWTLTPGLQRLTRYQATSAFGAALTLPVSGSWSSLSLDAAARQLWVGGQGGLQIVSDTGTLLAQLVPNAQQVTALSATPFVRRPTLARSDPASQSIANNPRPSWRFTLGTDCNGTTCTLADPRFGHHTIAATLDGVDVSSQVLLDDVARVATFTPATPLADGPHVLVATLTDPYGTTAGPLSAAIAVDTTAPTLHALAPADQTVTGSSKLTVSGQSSEAAKFTLAGQTQSGTSFSFEVPLAPGSNAFSLAATDAAGNSTTVALTYHRLTVQITSPVDGSTVATGSASVSGTFNGPPGSTVSVNAVAALLAGNQFSAAVPLAVGANTVTAVVSLGAASASQAITVHRSADGVLLAPPVSPSVPSTVFETTAFLYSGSNPVQTGVSPGVIEARRAAVMRGRVLGRDGQPLSGVAISVAGHPQYGQTLSRVDGRYDLAVNGGGPLTLEFRGTGHLAVQRQVAVPWQDFVTLPDVVVTALDASPTVLDFATSTVMQVARSSISSDSHGSRRATLLFPAGTTASMVLPGGGLQALASATFRATEYTVGSLGAKSMPAVLPPTSGYTYAVDLTLDEALAAGATDVRLSQAVPVHVENFLGFAVGTIVPVGYYDAAAAGWVASSNGRVIKILSNQGGVAELDADGDGQPDGPAQLTALGISAAELQSLATLYLPGTSLWRFQVDHFTPWDCNWSMWPPADAAPPPPPPPRPKDEECPAEVDGSTVECEHQVLRESIGLTGVPFALNYSSGRAAGYKRNSMRIPLSGPSVPASLLRIELEVQIAGQRHTQSFPALPNQNHDFTWDGLDAYGRPVQGAQAANVRVGFVYPGLYQQPVAGDKSFAVPSGTPISGSVAREEITFWQAWQGTLGKLDARGMGLGGWSPSILHRYDPVAGALLLGDGGRRLDSEGNVLVIDTVAGTGTAGFSGDAGQASAARLNDPQGVAVDASGVLFIADRLNGRIRRVGRDGVISSFATFSPTSETVELTVDGQGSLYYSERIPTSGDYRVMKVGPQGGQPRVVAGGGAIDDNDGGLATGARFGRINAIALDAQGSLLIAATGICSGSESGRIHRVDTGGRIGRLAGPPAGCDVPVDIYWDWADRPALGTKVYPPEDSPYGTTPVHAHIGSIESIAVDEAGLLYIGTNRGGPDDSPTVLRVSAAGMLSWHAGFRVVGGSGSWADGGFSRSTILGGGALAMSPAGEILVGAYNMPDRAGALRRIGSDDIVRRLAGGALPGAPLGDGGPAAAARLSGSDPYEGGSGVFHLAVSAAGEVFIADSLQHRVRRISRRLPAFDGNSRRIASSDGAELYEFDASGRHLRTLHGLSGHTLFSFGYDDQGRLLTVRDAADNITTIERDAGGTPLAIVSPYQQRHAITLDAQGYLQSLELPGSRLYQMSYASDGLGLLTRYRNPRQHASSMSYLPDGRLERDSNAAGGYWQLARAELPAPQSGYEVGITSAQGRQTTHRSSLLPNGDKERRTLRPDGTLSTQLVRADGVSLHQAADQTVTQRLRHADPRLGLLAPLVDTTITLPSGLQRSERVTRSAVLANPGDPLSLSSQTTRLAIDGREYVEDYSAATRQSTLSSPAGRTRVLRTDAAGRAEFIQHGGLEPVQIGYDSQGRIASTSQGSGSAQRSLNYSYGADGFVQTVTDALSRTVLYQRDAAGRISQAEHPGSRVLGLAYDGNDNLVQLTPPGRPAHGFAFDSVDLVSGYTPPAVPGVVEPTTRLSYSPDKDLERVERPDGSTLVLNHDGAGRLVSLVPSAGAGEPLTLGYAASTGQLTSLATTDATHSFTYDGVLLKTETLGGGVLSGTLAWDYDASFRATRLTLAGVAVDFGFDADSLLTQAGALSLTRHAQHGLPTGTTLGSLTTTQTYNGFGEPEHFSASHAGSEIYSLQLGYDRAGRITTKTEVVQGQSTAYEYGYDAAGRLAEVRHNGSVVASYGYDANGNRTQINGATVASLDEQDRLQSHGDASYTHGAAGERTGKTQGGQSTAYGYDIHGNLKNVSLPDGRQISYPTDARHRRIGKRVDGTLTRRWLYQGELRIAAELDAGGAVSTRFVYGLKANVPEYMVKGAATYRLITDHLGSVRLVVDSATGEVAQRMDYDEWGKVTADTNPGFQPFGYAGGLYDPDTGLVRFGTRDYDAGTGRWTAKDPIGFGGGDANLYAYVGGNPISYTDPTGLAVAQVLGAIVGGITGAIGAASNCDATWGDIALGAAAGAGTGFLTGGVSVAGTLLASVGRNALYGGLGNAAGQLATSGSVDLGQVATQAAIASAGGGLGNVTGLGAALSLGRQRSGWTTAEAAVRGAGVGSTVGVGGAAIANTQVSTGRGGMSRGNCGCSK